MAAPETKAKPREMSIQSIQSVSAEQSFVGTSKSDKALQADVIKITDSVTASMVAELAKGEKANLQTINAYSTILTNVAALEKSLPVSQRLSFSLTRKEVEVLIGYAVGGLILITVLPIFTPWAGWKSTDLANLFLYWSGVVAVLLGAQALPQLTGKSGTGSGSSSPQGNS